MTATLKEHKEKLTILAEQFLSVVDVDRIAYVFDTEPAGGVVITRAFGTFRVRNGQGDRIADGTRQDVKKYLIKEVLKV